MSAFDGVIKTKTRVPLDADSFQPGMGKLGKGSPTEEALIHGDQKLKVDDDVTELIVGDYNLKIVNDSTTFITGDVKETYQSDFDWMVNGDSTTLIVGLAGQSYLSKRTERMVSAHETHNVGPKMGIFVAPLTESHASPRQISEPAARMSIIGQELTIQASSATFTPSVTAVYNTLVQVATVQMQMAGGNLQPILANLQINGLAATLNGVNTGLSIGYLKNAPAFVWVGVSLGGNEFI